MKKLFLISKAVFGFTVAHCQTNKENSYRLQIDTLSKTHDSTFAKIIFYRNDTLVQEKTAYLFPDSIRVARFRLTGNLFKRTVYVFRVLNHGMTIEYSTDRKKKITDYNHGKVKSTLYYDKNNNEISATGFLGDNLTIGPCGIKQGEYIITGQKKK